MIRIDGESFEVDLISLKRKAKDLHKYAERTESGDLKKELIGIYFNYQLKFEPGVNRSEYDRLWEKLTEATEFHTVEVPYGKDGTYTFQAYFSDVGDELLVRQETGYLWNNLTVNFTAKEPARI